MPNYQNGKIYKIWSPQTELIYIGSTTQKLCERMRGHRDNYKRYKNNTYCYTSSFDIIEYDDAKIELIEEYKCDNKNQLDRREGELIRQNKDICINIRIAGRTRQEYLNNNKEKIKKKKQEYQSLTYNCVCGSTCRIYEKSKHFRTHKHNQYLQDNLLHLLDL